MLNEVGQLEYLNPLKDANDALRIALAAPGDAVLISITAERTVCLVEDRVGKGDFCRSICLACAKATGWEE